MSDYWSLYVLLLDVNSSAMLVMKIMFKISSCLNFDMI